MLTTETNDKLLAAVVSATASLVVLPFSGFFTLLVKNLIGASQIFASSIMFTLSFVTFLILYNQMSRNIDRKHN
jgi:hypothetical protein